MGKNAGERAILREEKRLQKEKKRQIEQANKMLIPVSKKTNQSLGIISFDPEGTFRFVNNRWLRVFEATEDTLCQMAKMSLKLHGRMRITMHMSGSGGRETCHISLMETGEIYEEVRHKFKHDEEILRTIGVLKQMSVDEVMNTVAENFFIDTRFSYASYVRGNKDWEKECFAKVTESDDSFTTGRYYGEGFITLAKERGSDLHDLADYVAIQINDTHPSMVIPELIRLLTAEGISFDEAVQIVTDTCAYTNHTILAEALEKWPIPFLETVAPAIVPIIQKLDEKVREQYDNNDVAVIDENDLVHMARMDMHYSHSVNGVAYLHTEILKSSELKDFYELYPDKFNNKTNGITFRRWLLHCNHELTDFLTETIGDGYKKDATKLELLMDYADDETVLEKIRSIKQNNKERLAEYLAYKQGISLDTNSIFDIQIKRLHEYKRQQLNALYAIHKYKEIKAGKLPKRPITLIFGAKAAPAYIIAKDIIHLILCLQKLIEKDKDVAPYLKVVMVENYNVTMAEKLIPACDIKNWIKRGVPNLVDYGEDEDPYWHVSGGSLFFLASSQVLFGGAER